MTGDRDLLCALFAHQQGLAPDARQHLRTMEHNGTLAGLAVVAPGVALLVGGDAEAVRLAQLPR